MSNLDNPNPSEWRNNPPGQNYSSYGPSSKGNKLKGCLITLIIGVIFIGLFMIAIISVLGIKAMEGPSSFFSSLSDKDDKIHENVITLGESVEKIVIINVNGIIHPGNHITKEHSPSETIIEQLKKAKKDPDVVAIVLDMNTPGGSVTATDEIYNELLKVRKEKKKVFTCMRTIAASGGYYLAAGTDYIFANRLTITGSIGVIIGGYNYEGLLQLLGVKSEVYKSGKLKDMLNMGRAREPHEAAIIQSLVDETHLEFAKIVAEGRNIDLEEVLSGPIGDAGIFSGRQAINLGLVDELGYLEDTIEKAKVMTNVKDPSVIRYSPHYSIKDLFFSSTADLMREMFPGRLGLVKKGRPYYLFPQAL